MVKNTGSTQKNSQDGSILVSIMMITLFLVTIIFSLLVLSTANLSRARSRVLTLQAQYAAESGADSAIAQLNNVSSEYVGSNNEVQLLSNNLYKATYAVTVANGSSPKE